MESKPRLIEVAVPARPAGTVVVLHASASRRANTVVSPTQLSVLRMIPVAHQIARVARGQLVTIDGGTHAMLRRHELFDGLAAAFASATLLGMPSSRPIARVQAGESWIRM